MSPWDTPGANLQAQFDDKQREIRVLEDAGHKAVLQQLALRRRQRGELEKWDENSGPLAPSIEELAAMLALPKFGFDSDFHWPRKYVMAGSVLSCGPDVRLAVRKKDDE